MEAQDTQQNRKTVEERPKSKEGAVGCGAVGQETEERGTKMEAKGYGKELQEEQGRVKKQEEHGCMLGAGKQLLGLRKFLTSEPSEAREVHRVIPRQDQWRSARPLRELVRTDGAWASSGLNAYKAKMPMFEREGRAACFH